MSAKLDGLHHVTAITADAAANLDFYGRLLGLRLVWQGVNADDPGMRHVAYGDECGSPGSIVTFFEMPGVARGRPGAGMVHRLLLRVAGDEALDFWERRLADDALAGAGVVVLALWLDTLKDLIPQHARLLEDKVVVDPSNPVAFDENGQMMRTLPTGQSAGYQFGLNGELVDLDQADAAVAAEVSA